MTPAQLPHDPALPHLAQALDGTAIAAVLAPVVAPYGWQLLHCAVDRIKYRPGRNCTLSYKLLLQGGQRAKPVTQWVAARLCSGGTSAQRHARAQAKPLQPSSSGLALQHLPALDMLTWWWPNDPKLAAPALLADDAWLRSQVLPGLLATLGGPVVDGVAHLLQIAQYVPEHRLCARLHLSWPGATGQVQHTVYAKAGRVPDAATAHHWLQALQHSPAGRAGRLRTPAALWLQADHQMHWQQGLPGQPLSDLPGALQRLAPDLGAQLAALHATPLPCLRAITSAMLHQQLTDNAAVVAAACPTTAPALSQLLPLLVAGLHHADAEPPATLHGDLHPRNLLVDGERIALIDLDSLRQGPALLELGAWQADAVYRALLAGTPPGAGDADTAALLAGYGAAGGRVPSAAALAWATAFSMLTQRAFRCVVNLKPGRFALVPPLVNAALALARHRAPAMEAA